MSEPSQVSPMPCPICGRSPGQRFFPADEDSIKDLAVVFCEERKNGRMIHNVSTHGETPTEAIARWNRRVSSPSSTEGPAVTEPRFVKPYEWLLEKIRAQPSPASPEEVAELRTELAAARSRIATIEAERNGLKEFLDKPITMRLNGGGDFQASGATRETSK